MSAAEPHQRSNEGAHGLRGVGRGPAARGVGVGVRMALLPALSSVLLCNPARCRRGRMGLPREEGGSGPGQGSAAVYSNAFTNAGATGGRGGGVGAVINL